MTTVTRRPPLLEYVLPLRWEAHDGHAAALTELVGYLKGLPSFVSILVVDGSPPELRDLHARRMPAGVRMLACVPADGHNGKVDAILTAIPHLVGSRVVLADDDVRYSAEALLRLAALLHEADLVRPQNHFVIDRSARSPWHVRWDTARTLVNRAWASDYPGTLGVRTEYLRGGYDAGVLFENLELMRTVQARGGVLAVADDLFVPRLPPTSRAFRGQRVRQAYDSFAQPARLAAELSILPVLLLSLRRPAVGLLAAAAVVLCAERGRRRAHGRTVFPADAALWAPLWLVERGVCAWIAVGARVRGGMPYRGTRLRTAANSLRTLRRRETALAASTPSTESAPSASAPSIHSHAPHEESR